MPPPAAAALPPPAPAGHSASKATLRSKNAPNLRPGGISMTDQNKLGLFYEMKSFGCTLLLLLLVLVPSVQTSNFVFNLFYDLLYICLSITTFYEIMM